jgi:hypothetical protein
MIDLIKQSAVPANVVRSAARGALTLPTGEMIEILVYLTSNPIFAEQAKMTLAAWDEASAIAVARDPATPWEVLAYWTAPENLRPKLAPALFDNPSVRESVLAELAQRNSREMIQMLLQSKRVRRSSDVLHALTSNPALTEKETAEIHALLKGIGEETQRIQAYQEVETQEKTQWEVEHAAEIAAEEAENKPFTLFSGDIDDENVDELEAVAPVEESEAAQPAAAEEPGNPEPAEAQALPAPEIAAETAAPPAKPTKDQKAAERLSTLQKIARLGVGERIQLAMKGNKEERFILVRDGSKLVSQAVLQSPKLSDSEIETYAAMKNVQEGVLREIARNHKFMKNYAVIRTLANNPRTPLDLGLTLIGHLHVNDLKNVSTNKNLPDTLRKLALKRFRDKTEKRAGASG